MSGCDVKDARMGSLCLRARSVDVKLVLRGDNYRTRKCAIVSFVLKRRQTHWEWKLLNLSSVRI